MCNRKVPSKYRYSEVDWIGEIPERWEISRIKFISHINQMVLTEKTDGEVEIDYIDISSVDSNGEISTLQRFMFKDAPSRARRIVSNGDTIVSTVRTYLKAIAFIEISRPNLICSTGFAVLTPRMQVAPKYLFYLMRSHLYVEEIVKRSVGVSYPAVNSSDIGNLECLLPDIEEQKSIVKFLDLMLVKIDELIADKEKTITLLQAQRRAIISEAVSKGLDRCVKMKDSGIEWIGEIPKHWEVKKLRHVSNITRLAGAEYTQYWHVDNEGEIIALRGQNIGFNRLVDLQNADRISNELSTKLIRSRLFKNEIVFPCVGTIGNAAIIQEDNRYHINQNIAKIRCINGIDPDYLLFYLLSDKTRYQIIYYNTSDAQPSVLVGNLRKFLVVVPPLEEQKQIGEYLNLINFNIDETIDLIEQQLKALKEYRDSVILEAVVGKIDVLDYLKNSMEEVV